MTAPLIALASADRLTVLTTFGPVLAKRWQRDGTITSYDSALQFRVSEQVVANIEDLATELNRLAEEHFSAVVRGHYIGDDAASEVMAALLAEREAAGQQQSVQPGAVFRRGALFRDLPRRWLMLDVDGVITRADPLACPEDACLEFVHAHLPSEFRGVSFYWSLSGSAGAPKHAGKLKAHLWFWLDEAYTCAQLRAWSSQVPEIDSSLFQPVQLHYTASPVFFHASLDPVPVRSGLCRGEKVAVPRLSIPENTTQRGAVGDSGRQPMQDPGKKAGLIGAFCRIYQPANLIDLLPEEFERGRDGRHFSWLGHDVPDGICITSCGHGLVNVHDSAPTGPARRCNLFDFVRLHRFGALDGSDIEHAPMQKRPSWLAMVEWIKAELPEVMAELEEAQSMQLEFDAASCPKEAASALATKQQVIEQLRAMSSPEVASRWVAMAKHLPKSESAQVVDEVAHLTGSRHRRPLLDALQEAQEHDRRERAAARHRDRIGGRSVIRYHVENKSEVAREIERLIVERIPFEQYFAFSGQLSRLAVNVLPGSRRADDREAEAPAVPRIEPLNFVNVLELAEKVAVLEAATERGVAAIGVPQQIVRILLEKNLHACATVAGLVTHPLVFPDGCIVSQNGLDGLSGLYFSGAELQGARPYQQDEAREALKRLRAAFLLDFVFRSPLDEDCAIAALITGVQRRGLDIAPGVAVLAPGQSSGKTTLARRIHLMLTGHDMPVIPFPEGNEDEVAKQLLATLMCSPAAICFDNLVDGMTFRSGCIAAALTGPQFSKRILGESRVVTCPTNTLFMLTGNNVSLGADEVTRWLTVNLRPATDRPDQREFKQPDVVAHALGMRPAVLRDIVGIVAGFLISGERAATRCRFPMWDRMVRQPLMWAGGADVAEVFSANTDAAEETQAYRGLILLLYEVFQVRSFTAAALARVARTGSVSGLLGRHTGAYSFEDEDGDEALGADEAAELGERTRGILSALRARDPGKPESVGRVLKAAVGRPVEVAGVGLMSLTVRMLNGYANYRIEPV